MLAQLRSQLDRLDSQVASAAYGSVVMGNYVLPPGTRHLDDASPPDLFALFVLVLGPERWCDDQSDSHETESQERELSRAW